MTQETNHVAYQNQYNNFGLVIVWRVARM